MFPLFLDLAGRRVVLVGRGPIADAKRRQFSDAGADVRPVEPETFTPADLDDAWLVVSAGPPEVNRAVADTAGARRVFVNAVDDPPNASAYLGGVIRRGDVTIAVSTDGHAPALAALLREALDELLPADLDAWVATARDERTAWRRDGVPIDQRKPLLLQALNRRYP
ncbi:MAG TPA: NAD(P)-dependent oxidoreductase [Vicinamibacterales bacterium]|nr:NAD(P)-dependent oxidoreductase [Vicinamibacterales bacterium]